MRGRFMAVVVFLVVGCGGSFSAPGSIAGSWALQILAGTCSFTGILNGADGLGDETFFVSENGSSISASFADNAGNSVTFAGTYSAGRVTGTFTIQNAGGSSRILGVDVDAFAFGDGAGSTIEGDLEVTSDSAGVCTGSKLSFMASVNPGASQQVGPTASTGPATGVGQTAATLNGSVNPNGAATTYFFEWGSAGFQNTTPVNDAGGGSAEMAVDQGLSDLEPGRTYQYRIVAANQGGVVRGETMTFTTSLLSVLVFVGHGYSEDVDVVDLETMTVVETIVDAGGYRMVLSADGRTLYSTGGDDLVYISDTTTFTLTDSFDPSDGFPSIRSSEMEPIAISPDGSRVYVADESGDEAVFVIDTATNTVIDAQSLEMDEPENAVVSPDGAFLYIVDNSEAVKIDTATLAIVGFISVGSDAHGVALNADGSRLYAEGRSTGIDVIDTATMTLLHTVNTQDGGSGYYVALSRDGKRIYAVDEGRSLVLINLPSAPEDIVQSITLNLTHGGARGITTTVDGKTILVASSRGLMKIDAETLKETGFLAGSYQSVVIRDG